MYLSGVLLGLSVFYQTSQRPVKKIYDTIRVYGNAIIDKLKITNNELTNDEFKNINITETLIWEANTIMAAEFENNLSAGNIESLSNPIEKWQINRRETNGITLTNLGEIDAQTTNFIDYTVQSQKNYIYDIFPITNTEIGRVLESDSIYSDFWGWFLVGDDNYGNILVYNFDLNLSSDTISNETNVTVYDNYTKYPSINMGDRDYIKGKISCIAGTIENDGKLLQTSEYLLNLKSFINNKKPKYLKNRKGDIWRVLTYGMSQKYMDEVIEQPTTISFDFIQIDDV